MEKMSDEMDDDTFCSWWLFKYDCTAPTELISPKLTVNPRNAPKSTVYALTPPSGYSISSSSTETDSTDRVRRRSSMVSEPKRSEPWVVVAIARVLTVPVGLTFYGVAKIQNAMMDTAEFINDPRHPRFKKGDLEKK
ncbi:hypothetical protein KL921_001201 [Ogataea angusta]|uniref:Uncharacterized protein n=1 Tax=Pichia angusta TaxID=870730 RepID=A0AAN6DK16_PICAN|nr:uncharacterized protein KL928_001367 [Ogataea angusta]KAG7813655.1 hypothetical protein KL921_001201 [Ogataea angusta]KAG7821283.1 hypothetical protein KL928_001367 [Ogataea angusta]KAG7852370.1 hypothetical protein KL940_000071 [Ogataea angusta]KAG7859245.1 hypothetical protein KL939_002145 [Ogataea angusta]